MSFEGHSIIYWLIVLIVVIVLVVVLFKVLNIAFAIAPINVGNDLEIMNSLIRIPN